MSEAKKQHLKRALVIAFTVISIGFLIYFIINNASSFSVLKNLTVGSIALCFFLAIAMKLLSSLDLKVISRSFDIHLDFIDWFGVSMCSGAMATFLPLRADYLLKAGYYKKKRNMSYSQFIAVSAGAAVIQLIVIAIEIALSFSLLLSREDASRLPLLIVIAFLVLIFLFLFLISRYRTFFEKLLPFKKYTLPIFHGFLDVFRSKKVFLTCFCIHIFHQLFSTLQIMVIAQALGVSTTFASALIYNSVITLSNIFQLIPGNIGITEALIGLTSSVSGGLFANGVVIALVSRVINLITLGAFLAVFMVPVTRRLRTVKESNCTSLSTEKGNSFPADK